jgi:hypothetical protein
MGDSDAPVAGQYGGYPHLPPDVEWSGSEDFIASVDCAAIPVGELDIPLPEDGHLLFFADRRSLPFPLRGQLDWHMPDANCNIIVDPIIR